MSKEKKKSTLMFNGIHIELENYSIEEIFNYLEKGSNKKDKEGMSLLKDQIDYLKRENEELRRINKKLRQERSKNTLNMK